MDFRNAPNLLGCPVAWAKCRMDYANIMKQPWQMRRQEFEQGQFAKPEDGDVVYRGISPESGTKSYRQGKGLYTTGDRQEASGYGQVFRYPASSAKPKKPLKIRSEQDWDDWILRQAISLGFKNIREFNTKFPDPGKHVQSLGYDGVQIGQGKKATFVNYLFPHHESLVRDALAAGHQVPEEVLNDYPHLAARSRQASLDNS